MLCHSVEELIDMTLQLDPLIWPLGQCGYDRDVSCSVIGKDVISYKEVSCEKVNSFVVPTLSSEVFYMLVRGRPEIVPNKSSLLMVMGWMSIHARGRCM